MGSYRRVDLDDKAYHPALRTVRAMLAARDPLRQARAEAAELRAALAALVEALEATPCSWGVAACAEWIPGAAEAELSDVLTEALRLLDTKVKPG